MKLVTFEFPSGSTGASPRVGIVVSRAANASDLGVIDLAAAARKLGLPNTELARDMITLMTSTTQDDPAEESRGLKLARQVERAFKENPAALAAETLAESSVRLLSPVPRPVSMRDGYAFRQHVETSRRNRGLPMIPEFDQFPVFYYGNHLTVTGPGEIRVHEQALNRLDYELEVAVVIGREGRNIKASQADQHIFAYMIMNDWSARAIWMEEESKLSLGPAKAKDFATSLGPYLVPKQDLAKHKISGPHGDRFDLTMKAFLNGKQYSQGNTKDMNWTFAQIIERASAGVTLYPGEVIGSGTVGTGCFFELNGSKITDNLWIKPGDEVVLEIEELGRLRNTVARD